MANEKIAIILAVYNENKIIRSSLKNILGLGADEVIVVDGASSDGTLEIIQKHSGSLKLICSSVANRAEQMNRGAGTTSSDIFVFIHADTMLPPNAISAIRQKIHEGFIGGGFAKRYDQSKFILTLYQKVLNLVYLRLLKGLVGTNAIFVRKDVFYRLQGYSVVDFMEDVLFSEKLKKAGPLAFINDPVTVSSRLYLKHGCLAQILRNAWILFQYKVLGRNPNTLRKTYWKQDKNNAIEGKGAYVYSKAEQIGSIES